MLLLAADVVVVVVVVLCWGQAAMFRLRPQLVIGSFHLVEHLATVLLVIDSH